MTTIYGVRSTVDLFQVSFTLAHTPILAAPDIYRLACLANSRQSWAMTNNSRPPQPPLTFLQYNR